MLERITVQRVNFATLMAERYFVIPEYQRHFSWGPKQCNDLFDDLLAMGHDDPKFMGYITTIELSGTPYVDIESNSFHGCEVVDGQQRLTSLMLLLAALIEAVHKVPGREHKAEAWARKYLRIWLEDGSSVPRIRLQEIAHGCDGLPTDLMRSFFDELTGFGAGEPVPILIAAQRRLRDAKELFVSRLSGISQKGGIHGLEDVYRRMISRLTFIVTSITSASQAGEMFEGLNNRGKPLTQIEGLKCYACYVVHTAYPAEDRGQTHSGSHMSRSDMIRKINDPISQIYRSFELRDVTDESSEAKFLASCWCLVYDDIVRAQFYDGDVPTEFDPTSPVNDYRKSLNLTIAVERGNKCADLASSIAQVLHRLSEASAWFADFRHPTSPHSWRTLQCPDSEVNELRRACQSITAIGQVDTLAPLFLACCARFPGDSVKILQLARLLDRVAFLNVFLRDKRTNFGRAYYMRLARSLVIGELSWESYMAEIARTVLHDTRLRAPGRLHPVYLEPLNLGGTNLRTAIAAAMVTDSSAAPAILYQWLYSNESLGGEMSFEKFQKAFTRGIMVRIVPRPHQGITPPKPFAALSLTERRDYAESLAGAFITVRLEQLAREQPDILSELDRADYSAKYDHLLRLGVNPKLLPRIWDPGWCDAMADRMVAWAVERWSVPESGIIDAAPHRDPTLAQQGQPNDRSDDTGTLRDGENSALRRPIGRRSMGSRSGPRLLVVPNTHADEPN